MDECEQINFEDNAALCKLLRIGEYAPWNHPSSRYWDLGNDTLYQFCEVHSLPNALEKADYSADKSKEEAAFASKMWLIGRSYAASPERYSYSYKKGGKKKGGKPKEVDPEGYESFFDDVTKILFRGACYYRGKHIESEAVFGKTGDEQLEGLRSDFNAFLEMMASLKSENYTFDQSIRNESQKTDSGLVEDVVACVVKFASLLQRARYVRDLGVVARNPKDKKVEKDKEQIPPELGNQSLPLSFSSKFLHFHIPQLFFIYDGISAGNLRIGYKRKTSTTITLGGKTVIVAPKDEDMSEPTKPDERSDIDYERYFEHYARYLEHASKEYLISVHLWHSLDEETRGYLRLGKIGMGSTGLPVYYYLTRMVDALVTNAD